MCVGIFFAIYWGLEINNPLSRGWGSYVLSIWGSEFSFHKKCLNFVGEGTKPPDPHPQIHPIAHTLSVCIFLGLEHSYFLFLKTGLGKFSYSSVAA